jgi:hypothetical protein
MSGLDAVHPELKALVAEATRALALLDADRLEELALSCQVLNRELEAALPAVPYDLVRQSREAQADMALFARVLEATRANLAVMNRLRALRRGRPLEYGAASQLPGSGYGDH